MRRSRLGAGLLAGLSLLLAWAVPPARAQIVPHVRVDGTVLVSDTNATLRSIAGQVDLKAGALVSAITGFGNTVLTSSLNTSWRGANLTSALIAQGSRFGGVQLNSAELVPGSAGRQVVVYRHKLTFSALTSGGFMSAPGSGPGLNWLDSGYWGAQGGYSDPPFSTSSPEPGEYFRTSVGDSLWGALLGSIGANFTVLWSYKP